MPTIAEAHELAREARAAGDAVRAAFIYERILKVVPEEAYALSGLATLAFEAGRLSQATSYLQRAIATLHDYPAFHDQLSMVYRAQGRSDQALAALREAVKLAPDSPELLNNLGVSLTECGQYDEAASNFGRALVLTPDYADAQFNLANALAAAKRDPEAIEAYRRTIELAPHLPEQHCALAAVLDRTAAWEESLISLRRALELKPDYADALYLLGHVLEKLGRRQEAQDAYLRAIELAPHVPVLKDDQVVTRLNRGAIEQAVGRLQQALAIKGDSGNGHFVLASALRRLDRTHEAELAYRRAIELAPLDGRAHTELAVMLKDQGRLAEARELFDKAVRLLPDSVAAHHNQALLRLLLGDFSEGFAEYEWRWRLPEWTQVPQAPRWTGDALAGGTLLLLAEQGIGDAIQFVRYAPLVKQRSGARVVLHCDDALHELLSDAAGIDAVTFGAAVDQTCDCYAPLLSLPTIFGTTVDNIPADMPYLSAQPHRVAQWKSRLDTSYPDRFKVGITWQGNPAYPSDARRSIPLANFSVLSRCPRVQLVSLQKGFGREQLSELGGQSEIVDLGATLDQQAGAFVETAAVIANLDLVITSDTAVAHLAGAMGAPVWVALALVPDWRWMLAGCDTPWYPTMRLFRQSTYGNWEEVFERMALELRALSDACR